MIVGDGFVWAHLPKTGGDATAAMFDVVSRIVTERDDPRSQRKHRSIAAAVDDGLDLGGRETVCNLRRLPAWLLSSARHQERHYALDADWSLLRRGLVTSRAPLGRWHRVTPGPVRDVVYRRWGRTEQVQADVVLERHAGVGIDRWLRQEHLADDFVEFAAGHAELTTDEVERIRDLGPVNANRYDHDVGDVFGADDLRTLYRANPRWAELERRVYGSLSV